MADDFDLIQLVDDDELALTTTAAAADDALLQLQPPSPTDSLDYLPLPVAADADDDYAAEASGRPPGDTPSIRTLPSLAELRQVVITEPPTVHPHDSVPGGVRGCLMRGALSLGVMQIIVALVVIPIAAVAIAFCAHFAFIGCGIWASVACILSGIASISAWSRNTRFRTIYYITMSILSAAGTAVMTSLSIFATIVDTESQDRGCSRTNTEVTFLIDVLLAILGMIQLVIAVINAAVACRVCRLAHAPPPYCVSNDFVLFDGVRCWTRSDFENPPNASTTEQGASAPPPYTLPPYTPPEMPPAYK